MRLALYQPDIPQNMGSMIRLAACMGMALDIIEPCGFAFDDRRLKRVAMDYHAHAAMTRHTSWTAFNAWRGKRRLVLFTTKAATSYTSFAFGPEDILLFGRESSGAPEEVHAAAAARLLIPVQPGVRSLNIVQAAAMAAGEAMRQVTPCRQMLYDGV